MCKGMEWRVVPGWHSAKEWGPHNDSHLEPYSSGNLSKPGKIVSKNLQERPQPADFLIAALGTRPCLDS